MKHVFIFIFLLCLHLDVFFSVGFDNVSLMEGDSVTLQTDVKINQEEEITWYFNFNLIAKITGDQSKIYTNVQCDESFRDRLKLDHQTGSLTIKNIKMTDSGYYDVSIFSRNGNITTFRIIVHGVPAEQGTMKAKIVKEGESVTLDPGVIKNPNDLMTWYFKDILIAEITGDQSKTCEDGDERFRERLNLDHQTGSLTIMNTRNTDSGRYKLQITSRNNSVIISSVKIFIVIDTGTDEDVDTDEVSVMEGDSVTLHTDTEADQQEMILWYFNGFQIAEITGDQSEICTDFQYTERFRDRLKLDHQTGSLTIMNITNTDSGVYELLIFSYRVSRKTLIIAIHGVSDVPEIERKSAKEGESVTLDPGVVKKTNDVMTWYFNDILIAQINGDKSNICTDDWCEETFRNRLEINNQTGSLTIINTRTTDSGPYKLQITSRNNSVSISSYKNFTVIVTGFFGVDKDGVSVFAKEKDSVTLHTDVEKEQMEKILWYFDGYEIAEITGNLSRIYTEDWPTERFRDRLKMDYQTGSLTITNTTFGDSGIYHLRMFSNKRGRISRKIFIVGIYGFFDDDTDGVPAFVKQGDSITLHTGVEANQQDKIIWYFYDALIAEITGDISYVCTDVQCEDGNERFRDRLKLDNQTGSLTITNIIYTDAGVYQQVIISSNSSSEKNFIVAVYGVHQYVYGLFPKSSLTLDPEEVKKPNDVMTWYFNDILIAEITGDQSKTCTEERCKQIFRDRLEVNHQTGSLTITNTRTKDDGVYKLLISSSNFSIIKHFRVVLFGGRVWLEEESQYVMLKDPVTLHTNVETNQQEEIKWYFNGIRIAEISGDLSFICTDVQCNNGTETFRDRLELDHQTGSLTIINIRNTDEGDYFLEIICNSSGIKSMKYFRVYVDSFMCIPKKKVPVSVMVKDSVTLHTNVKTNEQKEIVWRFNGIRIAVITKDLSFVCTDVQCKYSDERFRDRLKLDHQTGSLTIMNIRTSDAGNYDLQLEFGCSSRVFIVDVLGVFAAELVAMQSVKEGESVTLDPGELKNPYDLMTWYFNDTLIAKITGDHSKICTEDQCEDGDERFRDRLKLDHQTGSLTIMNTDTTDLGLYKLQITHRNKSISISSFRSFGVNVTAVPDSGLSTAVVAGASAAAVVVLLVTAAAGVVYCHKHQAKMNDIGTQSNDQMSRRRPKKTS